MADRVNLVCVGLGPWQPGADVVEVEVHPVVFCVVVCGGQTGEASADGVAERADLIGELPRFDLVGQDLGAVGLDERLPGPLQRLLVRAATLLRLAFCFKPALLIAFGALLDLGKNLVAALDYASAVIDEEKVVALGA